MSRKKREWYPGAIYHVMSRGNRRTVLFKDKADYLRFLECVERAGKVLGFQIHALCLKTNHFHMTIETADTELWKIMQRILHPYSMDSSQSFGIQAAHQGWFGSHPVFIDIDPFCGSHYHVSFLLIRGARRRCGRSRSWSFLPSSSSFAINNKSCSRPPRACRTAA